MSKDDIKCHDILMTSPRILQYYQVHKKQIRILSHYIWTFFGIQITHFSLNTLKKTCGTNFCGKFIGFHVISQTAGSLSIKYHHFGKYFYITWTCNLAVRLQINAENSFENCLIAIL